MNIYIDINTGQWGYLDSLTVLDFTELTDDQQHEVISGNGKELGKTLGKSINHTDNSMRNCISYSPSALREEADLLFSNGFIAREEYDWMTKWATDDELNDVAEYILNGDDAWSNYRDNVSEGIRWKYEDSSTNANAN